VALRGSWRSRTGRGLRGALLVLALLGAGGVAHVAKLRGARDRASTAAGQRVEERKGDVETNAAPVCEAKRPARRSPKTGRARSLRQIGAELARLGYTTRPGELFSPAQVRRLTGRRAR
jgi:hypothetical protein